MIWPIRGPSEGNDTMRAYDILLRKRQGAELSPEEIKWLIDGYTQGAVPDYQMAAWAMASFLSRHVSCRNGGVDHGHGRLGPGGSI